MNDNIIDGGRYSYWKTFGGLFQLYTEDKEVRDFLKKMKVDIAYYVKEHKKVGWQGIITNSDLRFLKKQFPIKKTVESEVDSIGKPVENQVSGDDTANTTTQ